MLTRFTTLCSVAVIAGVMAQAQADWNSPQRLRDVNSGKTPVLVFYANETAPSKQLNQLLEWVREADNAEAVLEKLEGDLKQFPATVDGHVSDIRELAPQMHLDYVLFTNRMARESEFVWYDADCDRVTKDELKIEQFDDPVYADSPLCHPATFRRALTEVAERFSPADHEFVLITFSHGDELHAMTSLYEGKLAASSRQNVAELVSSIEIDPSSSPALGQMGKLSPNNTAGTGTDSYTPTVGVTKSEYFGILRHLGETCDMQFAAVALSSCSSFVTEVNIVPGNVSLLCTSDADGLDYDAFDLSSVLIGQKSKLADNLEREIALRAAVQE